MAHPQTRRPAWHRPRTAAVGLLAGALAGGLVAMVLKLSSARLGGSPSDHLIAYALPVCRALTDLAAAALLGFGLLPVVLVTASPAVARAALRASVPANLVLVLAAGATLLLGSAAGPPGRPVDAGLLAEGVRAHRTALALVATVALGLIALAVNAWCRSRPDAVPPELRLIVAAAVLLPLPLSGHGQHSAYQGLILLTRGAHVIGAAAWTGGLFALALLVVSRRAELATALPRFSRLATVALVLVGGTGIMDALVQMTATPGGIPALWHSDYAVIALAKAVCLGLLALLGGRIRYRLMPRIAAAGPAALLGWAALELSVMGFAYGLAAMLAHSDAVL